MRPQVSRSGLTRQYGAIVGLSFTIAAACCFVIAAYLNRGSIQYFLSFHGNDAPAGYTNSVKPHPFGVHFFGDYLLPRWQSELRSPWFLSDTNIGPLTNYFPFTVALFWGFSQFPYWFALVAFLTIPSIVLITVLWKSLRLEDTFEKLQFVVTALILTYPFIAMIDRGNVQIFLIAALSASLFLFNSKHRTWAAILLGLAIAIKGYPIFLIALWIKARRWKGVAVAGITSIVLTVVPLLFYEGGVTRNLSRLLRNVHLNEDSYSLNSLAYNNSLRGSILTLTRFSHFGVNSIASAMYNHFTLVFLLLFVVACLLIFFADTDQIEVVMLTVVLMTTYVNYVAGYALSVFYLFIIPLGATPVRMGKWPMRILMGLIAIQMAPKGFPLRFWATNPEGSSPTYNSLLGGLTSLLIFVLISFVVIKRSLLERRLRSNTLNDSCST